MKRSKKHGGERKGAGRKPNGNVICPIEINGNLLEELRHFATLAHLTQVNAHNCVLKSGLVVETKKLKGKK